MILLFFFCYNYVNIKIYFRILWIIIDQVDEVKKLLGFKMQVLLYIDEICV